MREYSKAEQAKADAELGTLPRDGIVRGTMMPDYTVMRDQSRSCRKTS